ncbi:thrombospondin [Micromonospora sp. U56]|uniref:thrombospondin n=1 Tax=Micromonospora sp. U56 TaxID=2824900 RepID=UPI001B370C26|nr:thrombospondin [Micromonospora sp. U56]MBQ0897084.1 thrombospondin [Micromonospora sp. U56]
MKIPSLSRRTEPAPTTDRNGDGRVDGRDRSATVDPVDRPADPPVVTDRDAEQTTYRSNALATDGERDAETERRAAERAALARAATARSESTRGPSGRVAPIDDEPRRTTSDRLTGADRDARPGTGLADPTAERTVDLDSDGVPDRDEARRETPVVAGPRPRASLLATLGLIVSVVGALFVLTGTLAGYGIAVGAAGAVLSVLGLMATRRRHVAGKTDALIGILLGLAAVVVGVVAMTGQFDWPTADGEWVSRFREWLDSQFVDRF